MCKNEFYQDYYQDLPLRTLYNFILYFFRVLFHFLRIFEVYTNFWIFERNQKRKEKCCTVMGRPFGPWPWSIGQIGPSRPMSRAQGARGGGRSLRSGPTQWHSRRRRGGRRGGARWAWGEPT
jgi:hypothetical protein